MILGMYHETELYKGLEAVYPSIMSNPITVFMLPNRINEVQKIEDLKKLRGVGITKEHYSDYVAEQIKQYNLEMVDTPYELFERLFTKKADYIMVSQYYGLVEAEGTNQHRQANPLEDAPVYRRLKDFAAAQAYHPETYPFFRRSEKPTAD